MFDIVAKKMEELVGEPLDVLSKKEFELGYKAFCESLGDILLEKGEVRLGKFGKLTLVDVPERRGVSKLQGEEKEWVVPAHKTVKFKLFNKQKEKLN